MSILIFIVSIVVLIVVHEFGHFVAAKLSKMRVDEFGLGYPPRAAVVGKIGRTILSLNWLPLGGFVKIFGEDPSTELGAGGAESDIPSKARDSFSSKTRLAQAIVLIAGIAMNLLFAFVLITSALIAGTPRALSENEIVGARNTELAIASVLPGTPAARAGLIPGDIILSAEDGHYAFSGANPVEFTKFVTNGKGNATIALSVRHERGKEETLFVRPVTGVVTSDPSRPALGVEVATIGVMPLSLFQAIPEGASLTWSAIKLTATGLLHFFSSIFTLSADFSQVAGPVGIVGIVGAEAAHGFGNLFSIMAIISINLALINLIPIPALDGGRLLFVIIESIIRRPIKASIARSVNSIGFIFLILLMLVVTAHDIFRIVG
ncbi:MAG: M50 family metallopeptidase [Candidatus Kaiserbacteria bacterium]|nr:M50 family metallopeptidase [Candidatus Kaiserbacteria bacterium]